MYKTWLEGNCFNVELNMTALVYQLRSTIVQTEDKSARSAQLQSTEV